MKAQGRKHIKGDFEGGKRSKQTGANEMEEY
jgi:hypothetical protein